MAVAARLNLTRSGHVVVGVGTHKYLHVASVMDSVGGILASLTIATDTGGYQQLLDWAVGFGQIIAFGIEGTASSRSPDPIGACADWSESRTPSTQRTHHATSLLASRPQNPRPLMVLLR
jgi:hypothetical protein